MLTAVGLGSDAAGQDPTAGAWPSCRQTKARLLFAGMVLGLGIPFAQRRRIGLRLRRSSATNIRYNAVKRSCQSGGAPSSSSG